MVTPRPQQWKVECPVPRKEYRWNQDKECFSWQSLKTYFCLFSPRKPWNIHENIVVKSAVFSLFLPSSFCSSIIVFKNHDENFMYCLLKKENRSIPHSNTRRFSFTVSSSQGERTFHKLKSSFDYYIRTEHFSYQMKLFATRSDYNFLWPVLDHFLLQ